MKPMLVSKANKLYRFFCYGANRNCCGAESVPGF